MFQCWVKISTLKVLTSDDRSLVCLPAPFLVEISGIKREFARCNYCRIVGFVALQRRHEVGE
jgi:hypothetical protein